MKKLILLTVLASLSAVLNAQKIYRLIPVESTGTKKKVSGIIYGQFIQRLAFSSGGFPQDIRLINIDSQKVYSFRVKNTFKSAKTNNFCFYIPTGTYELVNYWYTKSKWYGGMEYTEAILKGKSDTTTISQTDSSYYYTYSNTYRFMIKPGSINYTGTWDFSNSQANFRDERNALDVAIKKSFKKIDFSESVLSLPR